MEASGLHVAGFNVASFSVLDWALVALLLYSTIRAAVRGLILEVFSLVGLAAGILLASWNYAALAGQLVDWAARFTRIPYATAAIVAYVAITIGVMVLCGLAGKFSRSGASAIGLGFVDRALGAVFGLARGFLLGVAAAFALAAFDPGARLTAGSQLVPYFLAGAHGVSFVVPEGLGRQVADGAAQIRQRAKHTTGAWIKP